MIELHRLNGEPFWVNHNLIEIIEKTPDTVIRLTTEKRYVVAEKVEEIIEKIIEFNGKVQAFRDIIHKQDIV